MNIEEIRLHTKLTSLAKYLFSFDTIDSTNDYAKKLIEDGKGEGTFIISDYQTSGKGRLGRSWFSEPGKNLTFSLILEPKIPLTFFGIIPLATGVTIAEVLQSITNQSVDCKWPNDVLINKRKVCGILCESISSNFDKPKVIVGIGININQSEFPKELEQTATSLFLSTGKTYNRYEILEQVLQKFEYWYSIIQSQNFTRIIEQWQRLSSMMGKMIRVDQCGHLIQGIATAIAPDGALILKNGNETFSITVGDIKILQ